ncbi:phosphotransferase [Streptosporangium subroseum]|uniref:phosphotransferase n=1 Tax=Streptosporangium subroseum TaxID=106412 RepID=UPI003421F2E6
MRCCVRDARPDRLAFLLGLLPELAAAGVPVPRPHQALDGAEWVRDEGDRSWVLLDYLPGQPLDRVPQHLLADTADLLARFHAFTPSDPSPVGCEPSWQAWLGDPDQMRKRVASLASDHPDLLQGYRPHLRHVLQHAELLVHLPMVVWTHGDVHGGNLLTYGGQVSALLDLDAVDRRPRIWDVAMAVLMLTRAGRGDYRLREDRVTAFLTGYRRRAAALTSNEVTAICAMTALSQLPDPGHLFALRRAGRPLGEALARPLTALISMERQRPQVQTWLSRWQATC